jgi:hypothetical protein
MMPIEMTPVSDHKCTSAQRESLWWEAEESQACSAARDQRQTCYRPGFASEGKREMVLVRSGFAHSNARA